MLRRTPVRRARTLEGEQEAQVREQSAANHQANNAALHLKRKPMAQPQPSRKRPAWKEEDHCRRRWRRYGSPERGKTFRPAVGPPCPWHRTGRHHPWGNGLRSAGTRRILPSPAFFCRSSTPPLWPSAPRGTSPVSPASAGLPQKGKSPRQRSLPPSPPAVEGPRARENSAA